MAICREFYFPSSDGSSRIHAAEWTPESGEIIGVLQIAHGVAEYLSLIHISEPTRPY